MLPPTTPTTPTLNTPDTASPRTPARHAARRSSWGSSWGSWSTVRGPLLAGLFLTALLLTVGQPAPAQAQGQRVSPPTPKQQDTPPTLSSILVLVLIGAAVVGVNFIPSKRGHQD